MVNEQSLMRELLRDVLEVTGEFEVVGLAADGREALGMVEETLPELVIMDLALPVMDGIATCREIRTLFPDVRVLMLAASVDQECLVGAVAAGATGYLQRCSGKEQLLATVRRWCGESSGFPAARPVCWRGPSDRGASWRVGASGGPDRT